MQNVLLSLLVLLISIGHCLLGKLGKKEERHKTEQIWNIVCWASWEKRRKRDIKLNKHGGIFHNRKAVIIGTMVAVCAPAAAAFCECFCSGMPFWATPLIERRFPKITVSNVSFGRSFNEMSAGPFHTDKLHILFSCGEGGVLWRNAPAPRWPLGRTLKVGPPSHKPKSQTTPSLLSAYFLKSRFTESVDRDTWPFSLITCTF